MTKPAMIGTVNGRVVSTAWVGKRVICFDGTTRDLAEKLRGTKPGTKVFANYGGRLRSNARQMFVDANGWVVGA